MNRSKLMLTRVSYLINAIWYLEILGFLIFIGAFLSSAIIRKKFVVMLPVDFSQLNVRQIRSLDQSFDGARLDSYSGMMVFHVNSSWENITAMTVVYMLLLGLVLAITYQLKRIFINFKNNQHFTRLNVNRLRIIAFIITIIPFVQFLFSLIANQVLNDNLKMGPFLELSPSLNFGFLITGVFLFSVIEILKIGMELEEENKLTV